MPRPSYVLLQGLDVVILDSDSGRDSAGGGGGVTVYSGSP